MKPITLNVFTDPTCPFAYSSEPIRWRLKWLYGDAITWKTTIITLSGYNDETHGLPPAKAASFNDYMRNKHGMPIDITVRPQLPITINACRLIIATKRNAPERAEQLIRELRIATMSNKMIDDQAILNEITTRVGLNVKQVSEWVLDPATEKALASDAEAARNPSELSLSAFDRKLSKTSAGVVRYPAPSYQFIQEDACVFELPGFWPLEALEAAIGNLIPHADRRKDPTSVQEILEWAGTPLATAEVEMIFNKSINETRTQLKKHAQFSPIAQDGFWSL